MNEQINNHHRQSIIERLMPGAGLMVYHDTADNDRCKRSNHKIYRVLSCMSAAIRSRADAHRRSTERVEIPSASEVSAVVKPAK